MGVGVGGGDSLTKRGRCARNPPGGHEQQEDSDLPHPGAADTCLRRTSKLQGDPQLFCSPNPESGMKGSSLSRGDTLVTKAHAIKT